VARFRAAVNKAQLDEEITAEERDRDRLTAVAPLAQLRLEGKKVLDALRLDHCRGYFFLSRFGPHGEPPGRGRIRSPAIRLDVRRALRGSRFNLHPASIDDPIHSFAPSVPGCSFKPGRYSKSRTFNDFQRRVELCNSSLRLQKFGSLETYTYLANAASTSFACFRRRFAAFHLGPPNHPFLAYQSLAAYQSLTGPGRAHVLRLRLDLHC
jgi:hypothetical protein